MAGRKRLQGQKPSQSAANENETLLVLSAVVDRALREFPYFLKFVSTIDEAETNPTQRIKLVPYKDEQVQIIASTMQRERVLWVPKSRRMLLTWLNAACLVWESFQPYYHGFIQTLEAEKADWLVRERVWLIYQLLPEWFKYIATKGKPQATYKFGKFEIPGINSKIWGVAQGADKFRAYTASRVFIDEAASQPEFEVSWTAILPLLEKGCRATVVSSAEPSFFGRVVLSAQVPGTFKEPLRGIQEWELQNGGYVLRVHYTSDALKDPARSGSEWVESLVKLYPEGKTGAQWRQEMEIEFDAYSGQLVYDMYKDEAPHVVEPFELPRDCRKWRAVDYGVRNPTACLWIAEIDSEFYIYREWYENRSTISDIKHNIWYLSQHEDYILTWIDRTTDNVTRQDEPTILMLLNEGPYGLNALPADNGAAGRFFIQELLRDNKLHIFSTCVNTRREFKSYRYEEHVTEAVKKRSNEKESPMKKDDHAMDALKYWANGVRWMMGQVLTSPRLVQTHNLSLRAQKLLKKKPRYIGSGGVILENAVYG